MWMQDGCKGAMDSYMASNGSCFMVIWTVFKNHLLEVVLTQHQETTALWTLTTVGLFYFIMRGHPHEHKIVEIAFGWGPIYIWLHTSREGPWPYYMILKVRWDGVWTLSFPLSRLHGHGSWLVCEVALSACDHYTSSTLIGGKGGAASSSLHNMLEGPKEYMNARWR